MDTCMSIPFSIRRATSADSEAIMRVHLASIHTLCAADYTPAQIVAWTARFKVEGYARAMDKGMEVMFVADMNGETVGFSSLGGHEVRAVYVDPQLTRRGIASALLTEVEGEARDRGIATIRLDSSLTAYLFYRAKGYAESGRGTHDLGNGVSIPCVHMHKELTLTHA